MRAAVLRLLFPLLLAPLCGHAQTARWLIAAPSTTAPAGGAFEIVAVAPPTEAPPERLDVRLKSGIDERVIPLDAAAPPEGWQRRYRGTVPPGMTGQVTVELAGRDSSVLLLLVEAPPAPRPGRPDAFESLAGRGGEIEAPLSENDPMYFVVGPRGGWSAKFQLSFKYRLFDQSTGVGRERPWLAGIYLGYTQTSIWDLGEESKPFRDTSYRPSLFWRWQRTDDRTWIDAIRAGYEHESNGGGGLGSRSIDTLFVRPEWHWKLEDDARFEFTPKFYGYVDKRDNPDIDRYRGHADWRLRYDSGLNWIATGVARFAPEGRRSVLVDLSRRIRDLRFGPVGGYLHIQYFNGYGESILDYNLRRQSQIRVGFSIVP